MTAAERVAFLNAGTRTAKVSVARASGAPHVAPVWFVLDGDDVIFTTGSQSVKGKALARDGRVALCVDDENPPFAYVIIEGTAELSADLDDMLVWATRLGGRYMGEENAEAFGRRNAVPEERLVRVRPTRIIARAGISD